MHERLTALFLDRFGAAPAEITDVRAHGSDRKLFRLKSADGATAIGVEHDDADENRAFVAFSRHFKAAGAPVPEIYAADLGAGCYLEEDLGDTTLFDLLQRERGDSPAVPPSVAALYEKAVGALARLQIEGVRGLDISLCHPHSAFDRRSMSWDLNYFR